MRIKWTAILITIVMYSLFSIPALWAQLHQAKPKGRISAQHAQSSGPNVTFTKNPTRVKKSSPAVSFKKPPKALTSKQRRAAILKARNLSGINKPNLPPEPPVGIVLTPDKPRQRGSWVDALCIRSYPGGTPKTRFPFWSSYCSGQGFSVRLHTVPGKVYILDVQGLGYDHNPPWRFSGAVSGKLYLENNHILATFIAKYRYTRIAIKPPGGDCIVTRVEATRLN